MDVTTFQPLIIIAQDLSVGYDARKPIIQHFDGLIYQGQFIRIFGANGAGKTTLLRCLLGLLQPLRGELTVLGDTPTRGDARIGYMPQGIPQLPAHMSGRALLAATIDGSKWGIPLSSRKNRQDITQMIAFVGAEDFIDQPFMQLSGGQRRRLLLAQALLGNPQILLLDEPLANLDPHFQHVMIELLARVQKEFGITVLLTAHDINPLIGTMTQVLYLAGGRAVMGCVDEVVNNHVLSSLYGSPIEVIRYQGRVFVMHSQTGQVENAACH